MAVQDKLFSGEPLFSHVELRKQKKLHVFPAVHSPNAINKWQEPCIIFAPHLSLRLGPPVPLIRGWHEDQNSLLVLEDGVDADIALLPFKPIQMRVLNCSFLSGIPTQKVEPLLKLLQPKVVVLERGTTEFTDCSRLGCSTRVENIKQENTDIARLEAQLFINDAKYKRDVKLVADETINTLEFARYREAFGFIVKHWYS